MKYLKKFNENSDIIDQIYNQFLESVEECFIEFKDIGWFTSQESVFYPPHFRIIMFEPEEEYIPVHSRKEYIDWTGEITSSGEIIWDTKELSHVHLGEITNGPIFDLASDFLIAVKRLNTETGLDFKFSYNNRGGSEKIIISGRI
jgi:hypothetical protein